MKNTWYLIGVKHPLNTNYTNYVESIDFKNRHWGEFQNSIITFTDSSNYALRLKSKMLAQELAKIVHSAVPHLQVEVLDIDERWFKL